MKNRDSIQRDPKVIIGGFNDHFSGRWKTSKASFSSSVVFFRAFMCVTHISRLTSTVTFSIASTHLQTCVHFLVYLLKTYTTTCSTTIPFQSAVVVGLHFFMHLYNGYCIKLASPSKNFYSFVFIMFDYMHGWAAEERRLSHRQLRRETLSVEVPVRRA